MSTPLPPSESKGMSMREYQRIYPHALSEQTLTESRMVHRALMHRLNKDLKAYEHQHRWQRLLAIPRAAFHHFQFMVKEICHATGNLKDRTFSWLLRDRPHSGATSFSLPLPRKPQVRLHGKSSGSYRF